MGRQSETPRKKRGPPATGKGEPILVRLQPTQLAALDAWMGRQDAGLSRPEAIRRLLEQALPSAPDEERQRRKRRLLKGPKEFRDMRDAVHSKSKG